MSTHDAAVKKQRKAEPKRPTNILDFNSGKQIQSKDLTFDMARDISEVIKAVKESKAPVLGYAFIVWTESGPEARVQVTAGHGTSFRMIVHNMLNKILGY